MNNKSLSNVVTSSPTELPVSALLSRLAISLDTLAGRTAQMQDDLSNFLAHATGNPSQAQLQELQALDLIHQTLDDLRAAAHLAAEAATQHNQIDVTTLAEILKLESTRTALLFGEHTTIRQIQLPSEIDLF